MGVQGRTLTVKLEEKGGSEWVRAGSLSAIGGGGIFMDLGRAELLSIDSSR